MEPGDSGGGLFDSEGNVIAIHSRIDVREDINYECPVNLFKAHWTSLSKEIDYLEIPPQRDSILRSLSGADLFNVDDRQDLSISNSVVLEIKSLIQNKTVVILGTHILPSQGFFNKEKYSWVVSKGSMIGDSVVIKDIAGTEFRAEVYARNDSIDLVLLRMPKIQQNAIDLNILSDEITQRISDLGITLISDIRSRKEISALSAKVFYQEKANIGGYFGAMARFIDEKVTISSFSPDSPAKLAGLMVGDQISMINGAMLTQPEHYGRELRKYSSGDTTIITGYRQGSAFELSVLLTEIPFQGNHPAYHFEGGRSNRFDGFQKVFPHDGKIKSNQTGSPVFVEDGTFVGLNIARFSRTCTLAIPADVILNFIAATESIYSTLRY
jgi:serine protease Do